MTSGHITESAKSGSHGLTVSRDFVLSHDLVVSRNGTSVHAASCRHAEVHDSATCCQGKLLWTQNHWGWPYKCCAVKTGVLFRHEKASTLPQTTILPHKRAGTTGTRSFGYTDTKDSPEHREYSHNATDSVQSHFGRHGHALGLRTQA